MGMLGVPVATTVIKEARMFENFCRTDFEINKAVLDPEEEIHHHHKDAEGEIEEARYSFRGLDPVIYLEITGHFLRNPVGHYENQGKNSDSNKRELSHRKVNTDDEEIEEEKDTENQH